MWISVKDRFPLNEEDLSAVGYASVEIIVFANGYIYVDDYQIGSMPRFWGKFNRSNVTHWQPLPEPPEEE